MEKINVRVTKPRRRKNGRLVVSKFYHLFWSVNGHGHGQRSLNVRDRQVAELKKLHSPAMSSNSLVLAGRMPTMDQMREHLAAAGIAYVDDQGWRLDFHALRMTFDTNLAIAGVPDAVRMKLMRHKSSKLALETYTDSEKVPVAGAMAKLPEFGYLENGKEHTGKDTEILVQGSPAVSVPVTIGSDLKWDKAPANIGESHYLSPLVIAGLEKSNGGERGIRTPDTV